MSDDIDDLNDEDDHSLELLLESIGPKETFQLTSSVMSDSNVKRNKYYSELEDYLIMKAYVSISVDPLHGSQQKANMFWAKVHQKYCLLASKEPGGKELGHRPMDLIKQHYIKVIGKAVVKFNIFLNN